MPAIRSTIVSRAVPTSNVLIGSVLGSVAIVLIFGLAVIWLVRYREQLKLAHQLGVDRKVGTLVGYNERYEFDRKEISTLYSLQRPKTAVVASYRTSFIPPNSPSRRLPLNKQSNVGQPPERGTISPPLKSSVWRGKQWVTLARPKTSTTPAKGSPWQPKTARPPMDLEKGRDEEKKSRVQRLSQLISKMKHEWHDVEI